MDISRESFWNHSIKKWSDIISFFILNDNIKCFVTFLDIFSTKKWLPKAQKKLGLPPWESGSYYAAKMLKLNPVEKEKMGDKKW